MTTTSLQTTPTNLNPLSDYFGRGRANEIVALEGYSAPYLYLIEGDIEDADAAGGAASKGPTPSTLTKLAQIEKALRSGAGQGRGDQYTPWIRIRRGYSSPVSHQVFESVGIHPRNHHFLSALEFHTALLTAYMGSIELRECLPIWPFEHAHPNADDAASVGAEVPRVPGLIEIAKDAGIEHGRFVGTTVPYIASLDLMHKIQLAHGHRYVGISCKPADILRTSDRARERVELDRLYCQVIGAKHVIEDGSGFDQQLIKNLKWFIPLTSEIRRYRNTNELSDFAGYLDEYADEMPLRDASLRAGSKTHVAAPEMAFLLMRLSFWLHLVDVDLAQPVKMTSPIRRGSAKVLGSLRAKYVGDAHA